MQAQWPTNARAGLFLSWGIELYLESSQLSIWWQLDNPFVRLPRCMSPLHQWICFSSRQVVMTSSVWNAQKAALQSQPILSSDFFLHFTDIFFFTICTNSPPTKCTGNEKKILSTLLCPQGYHLWALTSVCMPSMSDPPEHSWIPCKTQVRSHSFACETTTDSVQMSRPPTVKTSCNICKFHHRNLHKTRMSLFQMYKNLPY